MSSMRVIGRWTPVILVAVATGGCIFVSKNERVSGAGEPQNLRPAAGEPMPGLPPEMLPPPIDLTRGIARTRVEPTVIDTRDFPVQIQPSDPPAGELRANDEFKPPHARDETLPPPGELSDAPAGGVTDRPSGGVGSFFPGITQTGWVPPDPSIAVGPEHIVETVNQSVAFLTKEGETLFFAPLNNTGNPGFFEELGAEGFTFDPKCFYDRKIGRYFILALEVYDGDEAWITFAVSDDDDPLGVWYKYRTWAVTKVGNNNFWVDYPGLGYDDQAFYVTGNLFKLNGPDDDGFAGALVRIFDKQPLLTGQAVEFIDLVAGNSASVQVAQTYGEAPRPFLASLANSAALKLTTIDDPLGTPSLIETTVALSQGFSGPTVDAPNLGGGTLDTIDARLFNVHWRDGELYTGHTITKPGGAPDTVARWYHVRTNGWPDSGENPSLVQQGNIDLGEGIFTFFPAIASDRFGSVGLAFARSSAAEFASVRLVGRDVFDPPGTMGAPELGEIGSAGCEGECRWGDYFDVTVDPVDDETLWYAGQVQRPFGWETWIGSFRAGCPVDLNNDDSLNIIDFVLYQDLFNFGDPLADCNGDGSLNVLDFVCFQSRFSEGCP